MRSIKQLGRWRIGLSTNFRYQDAIQTLDVPNFKTN